jgi:hypothetical protein
MQPPKQTFLRVPRERFKDTNGVTYSTVLNFLCHADFSNPKVQQLYQQCTTVVVSGRAWAISFLGNWKDILLECRRICTECVFVYQQHEICKGEDPTKQSFFRKSEVQISSQRFEVWWYFHSFQGMPKYSNYGKRFHSTSLPVHYSL